MGRCPYCNSELEEFDVVKKKVLNHPLLEILDDLGILDLFTDVEEKTVLRCPICGAEIPPELLDEF